MWICVLSVATDSSERLEEVSAMQNQVFKLQNGSENLGTQGCLMTIITGHSCHIGVTILYILFALYLLGF